MQKNPHMYNRNIHFNINISELKNMAGSFLIAKPHQHACSVSKCREYQTTSQNGARP